MIHPPRYLTTPPTMNSYRIVAATLLLPILLAALPLTSPAKVHADDASESSHDIVIYGGTSAAVIAAVQAKRMGKSAIIVCPDRHLGGLTSGGLGWTDTGNKAVIGGLAKEFYQRVYEHYRDNDAWKFQQRDAYGNRAQGHRASDDELATMWVFEPHVAEKIFEQFIAEYEIKVVRDAWLDRENGVSTDNGKIRSITTLDGQTFTGRVFMDATYEGDLIAAAGVETTFGRESMDAYDESHAGVQTGVLHHQHHFDVLDKRIDPYVIPGDPSSGVIALVSDQPPGPYGSGDKKIQAYCFRTCLTNHEPNRVSFPQPTGYDPGQYEILLRCFDAGWKDVFGKFDPIPNFKTDTNNHGPVSFDNIGMNYDYPEAGYERRSEIIEQHRRYQQGLLYFIVNDPRVPDAIRNRMQEWGLPQDEFTDNGHWPHQIYVREARRMVGDFVITQNHLQKKLPTPDSVGMGSYTIDSHNTQRYITPEGHVQNEGDIGISTNGPYTIAMRCLLPRKSQCENLVVPVCVSSTHMAFGSIRMEPVFMILGQSAATIAAMAIDADTPVQQVPATKVRARLLADGQILQTPPGANIRSHGHASLPIDKVPGITVDDDRAEFVGDWQTSHSLAGFFGAGYRHDGNSPDEKLSARFATELPAAGQYEVRMSFVPNPNRSKQTRVRIEHAGGIDEVTIDQTRAHSPDESPFRLLGKYSFDKSTPAVVTIAGGGGKGYVVVDAINWRTMTD